MPEPDLPTGLTAVRLAPSDAGAVGALWRRCEEHDDGVAEITDEDVAAMWARPSFSLAQEAVGVHDDGALVGYAEVPHPKRADVCVDPGRRGRGIGAALMRWTWAAATARGDDCIGQAISEHNTGGIALLRGNGYTERWRSWVLDIVHDAVPAEPAVPEGYALRAADPVGDGRAAHQVIEDAFNEWEGRDPVSFEDFAAQAFQRPGFLPEHLVLAVHGDAVAGVALLVDTDAEVWVERLAVARAHRGRGLARALLQHAFGVAFAGGTRSVALATDSRTGALGLYEHVGMQLRRTYFHLARELP
jgi:mycothiol synthase